ncbi:putative integral membrane protein [Candidatus Sulfopaludibacter sp. SbA4]|nr:putative integral membrane protein [Candidatus Sulfopaludibacter sp. SbA4]
MRTLFAVVALAGLISLPALTLQGAQDRKDERSANREGERGKAAEYHFRPEHAEKLRQNYKHIEKVDVAHRPEYRAGGRLPDDWRKRMHPVPVAVIRELPPLPPGYAAGYFDGYCVVYDPTTLLVADVIDLAAGH